MTRAMMPRVYSAASMPNHPRAVDRVSSLARTAALAAAALAVAACASPVRRADAIAARGGLTRAVVCSRRFHHVIYRSRIAPDAPLFIFIGGDGSPWVDGGRRIAADPTAREPLALELAAHTHGGTVLYLGRPCYLGLAALPECRPTDWTSGRYSRAVVASLTAVANRFIRRHPAREVVLIGHSGGGALAVLMAPKVAGVRAVFTIAANLDVAAWTALHGYLPLTGSLDPARAPALPSGIREIDLAGGRDKNVPPWLIERYEAGHPRARLWVLPRFDHQCCWLGAWPRLLPKLLARSGLAGAGGLVAHP